MPAASREIHTATAGPGNINDATSYLGGLAASVESPSIAGAALYPSDAPPNPPELSQTSHGNGFANTGALDTNVDSPLQESGSIKFTQAGTYTLYCLVHPFMVGKVTVR
jgi:plastocyanin